MDVTFQQEVRFVDIVRLTNVPRFLHFDRRTAKVEGIGDVVVNVAYGKIFFATVDSQKNICNLANCAVGQ